MTPARKMLAMSFSVAAMVAIPATVHAETPDQPSPGDAPTSAVQNVSETRSALDRLQSEALSLVGIRYRYGGSTPNPVSIAVVSCATCFARRIAYMSAERLQAWPPRGNLFSRMTSVWGISFSLIRVGRGIRMWASTSVGVDSFMRHREAAG